MTELIPEMFVESSPMIFPFAFMLPANVETPETFNKSVSVRPVTSIPSALVANLVAPL